MKSDSEKVLLISPMERVRETALTIMNDRYSAEQVSEIRKNYEDFQEKFRELRDSNQIIEYLQNPENETLYDL
ncbi:hypothetical protein IJL65_02505 [bacterium]|nr:hypothetical protein [bacterium]